MTNQKRTHIKNTVTQFSTNEFDSLRHETVERISIMNSQAASAIGTIITIWAAGFGLLGIQFTNQNELSAYCQSILSIGQICAFFFSIFILIPMAIKSGENLRQLVSISIYIRVFYNYLSQNNEQQSQTLYAWETADKLMNIIIPEKRKYRMTNRLFNSEYTILSVLSLLFVLVAITINYNVVHQHLIQTFLFVFYGLVIIGSLFLIVTIHHFSSTKHNLGKISEEYTKKYLALAVEMGLLPQNELSTAWAQLNPSQEVNMKNISNNCIFS